MKKVILLVIFLLLLIAILFFLKPDFEWKNFSLNKITDYIFWKNLKTGKCSECSSKGWVWDEVVKTCPMCKGKKFVSSGFTGGDRKINCPKCNGKGEITCIVEKVCPRCEGKSRLEN